MAAARVLVVHNRHQSPGGEDAVVDAEVALLRGRGHAVATCLRGNADRARRTVREVVDAIATFRPDVIHAHSTFALLSASLYRAACRARVPVVQTLHDFRLLCVQATLLRAGGVCVDCVGRAPWRGVLHRCDRGSALRSAAAAATLAAHRALGTHRDKIARYIALNEFCRAMFVAGGLPAERIAVKPNFVDLPRPGTAPRAGGLYVGRLAPEKGIATLAAALGELPGHTIDAIGAGPERARLEGAAGVRLLGLRAPQEICARMRRAAYLVMPSIWSEGHPRTLVEAYACGLPVIASRIGALAELVEPGVTGLTFEPGSARDLARQIAWAEANPERMRAMGERARARYERELTPEANYRQLAAIYDSVIAEAARPAGARRALQ